MQSSSKRSIRKNGVNVLRRFYVLCQDFCSFLLVLRVMADENDLTNACKFIEGTFWWILCVASLFCYLIFLCLPCHECRSHIVVLFLQIGCISRRYGINLAAQSLRIIFAWMMSSYTRSKSFLI